jgi:LAO/AO transport system kinase
LSGPVSEHGTSSGPRAQADWRELARSITVVESRPPWETTVPPPDVPVQVVGVTGPPGAGKSTLVAGLIGAYTDTGRRVAVLAIDPSSASTGGAVLGDRVRMLDRVAGRGDVFVRSLASRGAHGALASCTRNIARLLERSGAFDVILVETVGAGQSDTAIASLADTVALVTVPALGDAVQTIKGGLLEVADIVVVNMADRPGAADTARNHKLALGRAVPVIETVATEGEGVAELRDRLDDHWRELQGERGVPARRRGTAADEAILLAADWLGACGRAVRDRIPAGEGTRASVTYLLKEALERWPR